MRFTRCYSAICFLRQGDVLPSACAARFSRRRAPSQCEEVDASTRSPVGTRFTKFHAPPKPHGPGWFWSTPRFDFFHTALASRGWPRLARAGRSWSTLALASRGWPRLPRAGGNWSTLALPSRGWPRLPRAGRSWPTLVLASRCWPRLGQAGRSWSTLALASRGWPRLRRSKTETGHKSVQLWCFHFFCFFRFLFSCCIFLASARKSVQLWCFRIFLFFRVASSGVGAQFRATLVSSYFLFFFVVPLLGRVKGCSIKPAPEAPHD